MTDRILAHKRTRQGVSLLVQVFGPDKPAWRSPFMWAKQTSPMQTSTSEN